MTEYKVGDRVRFLGNDHQSPDKGTVTRIDAFKVCAVWDSDNLEQSFDDYSENFEKISKTHEELEDKIVRLEEIVDALKATISVLSNHIMKVEK